MLGSFPIVVTDSTLPEGMKKIPHTQIFPCPQTLAFSNERHPELREDEEFYGNETEEEFRRLFADGLRVRMGLTSYDWQGNVIRSNLRPVFIASHDPLTVDVNAIEPVL